VALATVPNSLTGDHLLPGLSLIYMVRNLQVKLLFLSAISTKAPGNHGIGTITLDESSESRWFGFPEIGTNRALGSFERAISRILVNSRDVEVELGGAVMDVAAGMKVFDGHQGKAAIDVFRVTWFLRLNSGYQEQGGAHDGGQQC
jgi:hypothetical protein